MMMDIFPTLILVLGIVFLFLFAIRKFSNQINRVMGDRFKEVLATFTKTPLRGIALGTVVTSIIQSSTATTVLLVGLVDAGAITFASSLGVILGANIGTTITTQLVAFRILTIAPYVLIIGFLIDRLNFEIPLKKYGKAIFYFGLVFFCLALISELIKPLSADPEILKLLSSLSNIFISIMVGVIITVFFQSSTIVSSIVILLVGQDLLNFHQAFGIILGSNIGTTSTALLASAIMGKSARRTALAHLLFNVLGVIVCLPFVDPITNLMEGITGNVAMQVANAHLFFNILTTIIVLPFLHQFGRFVQGIVRQ